LDDDTQKMIEQLQVVHKVIMKNIQFYKEKEFDTLQQKWDKEIDKLHTRKGMEK